MLHRTGLVRLAIVGVLVAVVAGSTAWWVQQRPQQIANAQPQLHVDPAALDFGEVWETDRFRWELPITNRGIDPIEVERIQAGCNCLKVEPPQFVVPAGETTKVVLTIDFFSEGLLRTLPDIREFELPILAKGTGEKSPIFRWRLTGKVKKWVSVSPATFSLNWTEGLKPPVASIQITPRSRFSGLQSECTSPLFLARVHQEQANSGFMVSIESSRPLSPGSHQFEVVLGATGVDGKPFPRISIAGSAIILPDCQATPSTVNFGACSIGKTQEETIVLQTISDTPFEVLSYQSDSDDLAIEVVNRNRSTPSFRLIQRVSGLGEHKASVSFSIRNHQSAKTTTLKIPVTYHGIEP